MEDLIFVELIMVSSHIHLFHLSAQYLCKVGRVEIFSPIAQMRTVVMMHGQKVIYMGYVSSCKEKVERMKSSREMENYIPFKTADKNNKI